MLIVQVGMEKAFPVSLMCRAAILTMSSFFLLEHLMPFSCSHFFSTGTLAFIIWRWGKGRGGVK